MEFLKIPCNCPLLHRWKRHQNLKGFDFVVLNEVSFSSLLFLVANLFRQRALAPDDPFVDSHFYQRGLFASYPLVGYLHDFPIQGCGVHLVDWRSLTLHEVDWSAVVLNPP